MITLSLLILLVSLLLAKDTGMCLARNLRKYSTYFPCITHLWNSACSTTLQKLKLSTVMCLCYNKLNPKPNLKAISIVFC